MTHMHTAGCKALPWCHECHTHASCGIPERGWTGEVAHSRSIPVVESFFPSFFLPIFPSFFFCSFCFQFFFVFFWEGEGEGGRHVKMVSQGNKDQNKDPSPVYKTGDNKTRFVDRAEIRFDRHSLLLHFIITAETVGLVQLQHFIVVTVVVTPLCTVTRHPDF